MLEMSPGTRITTAALARQVGVSEAALYRHFPSKSKMFEGLLEFIEETVFTRTNLICGEEISCIEKCNKILLLLLSFTERNPGITRLLTGDALTGENDRLRLRVVQFFDRLESQLKQLLRESEIRDNQRTVIPVAAAASLLMVAAEGRIAQFVRSEFKRGPSQGWPEQWPVLTSGLLQQVPVAEQPASQTA